MFNVRVLTVSESVLLQPEQEAAAQGPVLHHRRRCHAPCGPRTLKGPRRIWRDPDVSSRFRRQLRVGPPTWPRYLHAPLFVIPLALAALGGRVQEDVGEGTGLRGGWGSYKNQPGGKESFYWLQCFLLGKFKT